MKTMLIVTLSFLLTSQTIFADITTGTEEKNKDYETQEVKTQVDAYTYEAKVYLPKKQSIKAVLLISPVMSGPGAIEASSAQYFSSNGYLAIVTYPFYTELNSPTPRTEQLDIDYMRPVSSAVSFLDLVQEKYQLPADIPVFAMGASRGGITTLILASHIPRIKAAWFAVGGGDLPHIYAWSTVDQIKEFRNNHMKVLGIGDKEEYERYLKANLKNDPLVSCQNLSIPVHQTIALRDTSVPTHTQELVADQCPRHEILRMNVIHTSGTLTNVTMRKKIKAFFEKAI